MPTKFDHDRIGRALNDLHRLLGRIEVKDAAPPQGESASPVGMQTASMPTEGGGDELLSVTAMPTKEGGDELLTISLLAW